jgi:magnesium transporter
MEWHRIFDPSSPDLDTLAERYHLHPLHIEDCRHRNQNAKIEESEGYIFTVLKGVWFDEAGEMLSADLDIFLGKDFVITVVEEDCSEFRDLIEQIRKVADRCTRADQLYYRVIDQVVDRYPPILDRFDESIDAIEDQALNAPVPATLSNIFNSKRSLIILRRILVNTRDVARYLQRTESPFINREMWPFLSDVHDHVTRNLDTVEMQRDLLSGALDVYLSSVANRTNQVMKVLTVLGTIALPALVVSSFYGMNIKGLPGADSPFGLVLVFAVMVGSTFLLLWLLKRFGWL